MVVVLVELQGLLRRSVPLAVAAEELGRRVGVLVQAVLVVLLEFGHLVADEVTVGHEALGEAPGLDVGRPGRVLLVGERGFDDDGHDVGVLVVVALVVVERLLGRRLAAARRAHEVAGHFAAARLEVLAHVVDAVRDVPAVLQVTPDEPVLVQHDRPRLDVHGSATPFPEQPLDRRRRRRRGALGDGHLLGHGGDRLRHTTRFDRQLTLMRADRTSERSNGDRPETRSPMEILGKTVEILEKDRAAHFFACGPRSRLFYNQTISKIILLVPKYKLINKIITVEPTNVLVYSTIEGSIDGSDRYFAMITFAVVGYQQ